MYIATTGSDQLGLWCWEGKDSGDPIPIHTLETNQVTSIEPVGTQRAFLTSDIAGGVSIYEISEGV